ncbi:hypothetical protein KY289_003091 [Solanum tuberosum]|nr:hypothetical protein KY289_003091 [Solanum tuberosum]
MAPVDSNCLKQSLLESLQLDFGVGTSSHDAYKLDPINNNKDMLHGKTKQHSPTCFTSYCAMIDHHNSK